MTGFIIALRSRRRLRQTLPAAMALLIATAPITVAAADDMTVKGTTPPPSMGIPGIKTLAQFPAANDAGASGGVAASAIDTALKLRLNMSGKFQVTSFSTRLPSIQRALNVDNSLTSADVQAPITEPAAAQKIARVMACDGYLLDEIDSYNEDATTHDISITVSGSVYYTSTGAAARTFAVTGTASPKNSNEPAAAILQRAVNDAATEISVNLGVSGAAAATVVAGSEINNGNSHGATGLLIVLAGILIGVIAHNVSSHGNSGSPNSPGGITPPSGSGASGPPSPPTGV